ncbi:hypothetical protein [Ochrobactrum sp. CGA5]|nr:hypothetical protein [Ochrobactrum sp. CGA5]
MFEKERKAAIWAEALEMTANVADMPLCRREMTTKRTFITWG